MFQYNLEAHRGWPNVFSASRFPQVRIVTWSPKHSLFKWPKSLSNKTFFEFWKQRKSGRVNQSNTVGCRRIENLNSLYFCLAFTHK